MVLGRWRLAVSGYGPFWLGLYLDRYLDDVDVGSVLGRDLVDNDPSKA